MATLRFWVEGIPVPQGSKVAAVTKEGRPYLRDVNSHALKAWRRAVHDVAGATPFVVPPQTPVIARMTFWLPRPKDRPKTLDVLPIVKPDVDKLARSVMDSLTSSGVIKDDALVYDMHPIKRYAIDPDALPKIYTAGFHRTVPGVEVVLAWLSV